jgi:hypothetical protein
MGVEIRPAVNSDIPELARMVGEMAAYHESIDERVRFDWKEIRAASRWLKLVLERDHHAVWVADHGEGILVGYLWVHLRRLREGTSRRSSDISATLFWRSTGAVKD